jgi:hypothetical protein
MISLWGLAIAQRIRLSAIASQIIPYPTRTEAGKRAVGEVFLRRLFAPLSRQLVRLLIRLP